MHMNKIWEKLASFHDGFGFGGKHSLKDFGKKNGL
jgi:hypothetical protein